MPTLASIVLTAQHQEALVTDCVHLVEQRIAARGGLRGAAVKTSLSLIKAARPDFLARAMRALLPEFVAALEPLYQDFAAAQEFTQDKGGGGGRGDFAGFLQAHSAQAVAALLGVADDRAARLQNPAVKSVYARLRGGAEEEVAGALPGLAALLGRHLAARG
jgi:hypothetical protein